MQTKLSNDVSWRCTLQAARTPFIRKCLTAILGGGQSWQSRAAAHIRRPSGLLECECLVITSDHLFSISEWWLEQSGGEQAERARGALCSVLEPAVSQRPVPARRAPQSQLQLRSTANRAAAMTRSPRLAAIHMRLH